MPHLFLRLRVNGLLKFFDLEPEGPRQSLGMPAQWPHPLRFIHRDVIRRDFRVITEFRLRIAEPQPGRPHLGHKRLVTARSQAQAQNSARRSSAHREADCRCVGVCTRTRRDASRSQAGKHQIETGWYGESSRFRIGEGIERRADRKDK
jgi:hypothetical protein